MRSTPIHRLIVPFAVLGGIFGISAAHSSEMLLGISSIAGAYAIVTVVMFALSRFDEDSPQRDFS